MIEFYRFIAEKLRNREMINESYLLIYVRELRNIINALGNFYYSKVFKLGILSYYIRGKMCKIEGLTNE